MKPESVISGPPGVDSLIYQIQSSAMDEVPDVPQPLPAIPRRPLWLTLAIPPLVTLLTYLIIPSCGLNARDAAGILALVPLFVSFGLIPGLAFHFHDAVRHRYRGASLGFLVFSYIFCQIIACVVLSIGSWLLVSAQHFYSW